jgi:hypothetical protein
MTTIFLLIRELTTPITLRQRLNLELVQDSNPETRRRRDLSEIEFLRLEMEINEIPKVVDKMLAETYRCIYNVREMTPQGEAVIMDRKLVDNDRSMNTLLTGLVQTVLDGIGQIKMQAEMLKDGLVTPGMFPRTVATTTPLIRAMSVHHTHLIEQINQLKATGERMTTQLQSIVESHSRATEVYRMVGELQQVTPNRSVPSEAEIRNTLVQRARMITYLVESNKRECTAIKENWEKIVADKASRIHREEMRRMKALRRQQRAERQDVIDHLHQVSLQSARVGAQKRHPAEEHQSGPEFENVVDSVVRDALMEVVRQQMPPGWDEIILPPTLMSVDEVDSDGAGDPINTKQQRE